MSPSWSPNGREIVFTSGRAGTPQLYIMSVDGTDVRRITFEGSYNASPNWSPRGDRIVFVSQVKGLFKIATVNPDGSDFRLLTTAGERREPRVVALGQADRVQLEPRGQVRHLHHERRRHGPRADHAERRELHFSGLGTCELISPVAQCFHNG